MSHPLSFSDANAISRAYLDSLLFEMRHIGAVLPDTSFELFGEHFSTPVTTAALSHLKGKDKNGMVEMAEGCAQNGAVCFAGMGDTEELGQMAATGARFIKIIKPYQDRDMITSRLQSACEQGALAVGMDLDHTFNWEGEQDIVLGLPMAPLTESELAELVKFAGLPFVFKGVLSVHDAQKAMDLGAKGIVVSHHHGILPYAAPPLLVLPDIVAAVKGRMKIFVDCGISSGYDVFKALALGADAVSVGRAIMEPLKEHGGKGVADRLSHITKELRGVMARTACANLSDIGPHLLWKRAF